ncbi:MAG TPA: MFS transporter [Streptosporangiaceae bacterium]|jgi:MFS family permease
MSRSPVLAAAPGPAAVRPARRLPRSAGFAVIVAIMVLFQAAASAPAPLYVVYQRLWAFSAGTLTLIFAIFVLALLGTLLVAGQLSDYRGRRPVLLAAIALEAGALVLFLLAGNVAMLLAARAVQGIATGLALPALGATLVDFNPPHAPGRAAVVSGVVPVGGLAAGALACSSLVSFAPDPVHLVWILLLAALAVALAAVLALPEPATRQPGARKSLAPRLGIPGRLRREVVALFPVIVASWALGGLYLSLGPSAAVGIFGLTSHFDGGLVVTLLCGTGAVTAYALRGAGSRTVLRASTSLLAAGTAVTLGGVLTGSLPAAIAGTALAGVGYGASGLAAFGTMARLAGPADAAERGGLFAVAYVVAYLAFSLPALAAGYVSIRAGLRDTVAAYSLLVIVIAAAALAGRELRPVRG